MRDRRIVMRLSRSRSQGVRHGHRRDPHRSGRLRAAARARGRARPRMSGADLFGLIASALVFVYLLYALLRGERLEVLPGGLQVIIFLGVLLALTPLIGGYMARVYTNERVFLPPV